MTHKHTYDDHNLCFECDKEKPVMNETQFNILATELIKKPQQREALKLHMLSGLSAYEAERRIYGKVTHTVSRDAKRVTALFNFCKRVMEES